jgi:hypothetical protein
LVYGWGFSSIGRLPILALLLLESCQPSNDRTASTSQIIGANTRARVCFEAFLAKTSPAEYGPVISKVKAELADMR